MRRNGVLASQQNAECIAQVQASIGRSLRETYDVTRPLTARLADLVREVGRPAKNLQEKQVKSPG
jgi:hypothetical protein